MDNHGRETYLREAFGVLIPRPSHPRLRQLKLAHQPHLQGYKMWNSTWLLLEFLGSRLSAGTTVLDAGCGWGLASVWCRRHGATVIATDADPEVLPYLDFLAEVNGVEVAARQLSFAAIPEELLGRTGLLIGADICFRQSMVDPVYQLLRRAIEAGVERIALADPGRPSFAALAARCTAQLHATARQAEAPEPLIDWPGSGLKIRGRLLCYGF